MITRRCKKGFSIIEVTVAVAIIVIVSALFLVAANKIETSGKSMLTKSTIEVLEAALEQYDHYGYQLHEDGIVGNGDYRDYNFPIDLRKYPRNQYGVINDAWEDSDSYYVLEDELASALNLTITTSLTSNSFKNANEYCYGHLAMIVLLNRVPTSRDVLATISDRNIKRTDEDDKRMSIEIDGKQEALYLITDGWGVPLRYWYDGEQAFPKIESAGPDGLFDTADDITNTQ